MLHLYIDTNVYLTFYHLTSEDLEELKKLELLIARRGEIHLHLPKQTFDEFHRNRETKIADALGRFNEEKLNNQFPQICKEFPEFKLMRDAIKEFDKNKSKLLEKVKDHSFKKELGADRIIEELFDRAEKHESTFELIESAKRRCDLGRPPGKKSSLGDAINWITLIERVPSGEDLHFISDDKDYFSEIDTSKFKDYLVEEWSREKGSNIYCYRKMSDFFKKKFPEIKIASEYEKDVLIQELARRGSFAKARLTLHELSEFDDFSTEQLNNFVRACTTNNQVYWIKGDSDIEQIIAEIVMPNLSKIDPILLAEFDRIFEYAHVLK
ncbi:MAG: DUF4935 domain-containing protein [Bacteroidetes bacterium]|nr:DUF4935 domain-containing protein [Bacteroidota bacterium]